MNKFIKINDQKILNKTKKVINKVLLHENFILGPEVNKLEKNLSAYTGSKFCLSVSSGTDALLISLMSLGIGKGDEVITSPFSWISTIEVILLLGAKPVFADIDERTFNIDATKIPRLINRKTKAIIPVSLFGQCCDMDAINKIAKKNKIFVIEDGAQSFGALYKGLSSCNLSTVGCTSFFPTKPLGSFGDAGACFTNNKQLYEKMFSIRNHGQVRKRYNYEYLGVNGRMDTIQAAIILEKLKSFKTSVKKRQKVAAYYDKLLSEHSSIQTPYISSYNKSVFAQYTIKIKKRDEVKNKLQQENIPTFLFYPKPLYKVKYMKRKYKLLKNVENVCNNVLSLPMNEYLSKTQQERIVEKLIKVCKSV